MNGVHMLTNKEKDFYYFMGPFLSRRPIVKELGNSIWDDDNKIWFVYMDNFHVRGFASLFIHKNRGHLQSVYVLPNYRNTKIGTTILDEVIVFCRENKVERIKSTVSLAGLALHKNFGFEKMAKKGKYTKMEKEL